MSATRYCFANLLLCLSLAAHSGWSQNAPAAPADTAGFNNWAYGRAADRYYLGELVKADGTRLAVYLPVKSVGYAYQLHYFTKRSATDATGEHHKLDMAQVRSMTVRGRTSEAVIRPDGKPLGILAVRVLQGPIDLLTHAEPRSIPIPIFAGVGVAMPILGIPLSDKNNWYLRRNGVMTEMKRGDFASRMSQYVFDYPELAAKVAAKQPGFEQRDVPAIIAEYNRFKSQPAAK